MALWKLPAYGAYIMSSRCGDVMEAMQGCLDNPAVDNSACANHLQAMFDCGRANGVSFSWVDGRPVPMAKPNGPLPRSYKPASALVETPRVESGADALLEEVLRKAAAKRGTGPELPKIDRGEWRRRLTSSLPKLFPSIPQVEDASAVIEGINKELAEAGVIKEGAVKLVDNTEARAEPTPEYEAAVAELAALQAQVLRKLAEIMVAEGREGSDMYKMLLSLDGLPRDEAAKVFRDFVLADVQRLRAQVADLDARRAAAASGGALPAGDAPFAGQPQQASMGNRVRQARLDIARAVKELDADGSFSEARMAATKKLVGALKNGDQSLLINYFKVYTMVPGLTNGKDISGSAKAVP